MQGTLKELNLVQEPEPEYRTDAATILCHADKEPTPSIVATTTTTTTTTTSTATTTRIRHDKMGWTLLPMYLSHDLQATDLGHILQDALERARRLLVHIDNHMNHDNHRSENIHHNSLGSVVFLGMDAPELPLPDIVAALTQELDDSLLPSYSTTRCIMCPADDGGYGMLSLPPAAVAHQVFQGVLWSHPLTAVSQLKALTDQHQHYYESDSSASLASSASSAPCENGTSRPPLSAILGQLMYDIDEPANVHALCQRLLQQQPQPQPSSSQQSASGHADTLTSQRNNLVLDQPSTMAVSQQRQNQDQLRGQSHHPSCYYTRQALLDLGVLTENEKQGDHRG